MSLSLPEPTAPPEPSETQPSDSSQPVIRPTAADRLTALGEVLLCSGFPTQLALAQVMAVAGLMPFIGGRLSTGYVFTLLLSDAVVLVALVFFLLALHGERPRDVLFGSRPIGREALLGVLLMPAVFLVVMTILGVVQRLAPGLHNVPRNPLEDLIRSRRDAWLFAFVAIVSGGLREEIQRAFILRRFEQYLGGAPLGLLLFSVIFGAGHVVQGWDVVMTTAALGLLWGAVYLARRSIVTPAVSHAGFNLAEIFRYTFYGP